MTASEASYNGSSQFANNGNRERDTFLMTSYTNGNTKSDLGGASNNWNIEDGNGYLGDGKMAKDEGSHGRHQWGHKVEYLLAMIGYSVGLGNVWRFPYICIRNGGGAFLIPFFICLFLCGLPLYFLEVALGQFVSRSPYHVWAISPMFYGIGIAMIILGALTSWYYNMIVAWILIFLVNSFKDPLPWTLCGQSWNTPGCVPPGGKSAAPKNSTVNGSLSPGYNVSDVVMGDAGNRTLSNFTTKSASEEFRSNYVLELSPGLEHIDGLLWKTAVALFVALFIVFVCLWKGIRTVGKVVFVTATLPYILITVLLIRGLFLPGATDGLVFYLKPDFSKLLTITTWIEASVQVFYSLGPAWGTLITMASYSKFNNNCMKDSIWLTLFCEGTSIYSGLATFTFLGHMSHTLSVPVANFSTSGPGLAFVVYPEAISYLPLPQLWGILFFLMLLTVGLDSQFVCVELVLTFFSDTWPDYMKKRNLQIKSCILCFLFLCSLIFCTRGGMYVFQLVDWYIGAFTVMIIAILECVVVAWIYGVDRFAKDIELMLGRPPYRVFLFLWKYVSPLLLTIMCIFTMAFYQAPVYEGYTFGSGGVAFGWFIATVSFAPIPICAITMLLKKKGTFTQRLKAACSPSETWLPSDKSLHGHYIRDNQDHIVFRLPCKKY